MEKKFGHRILENGLVTTSASPRFANPAGGTFFRFTVRAVTKEEVGDAV